MVSMDKKESSRRGPDLKLFVRDVRDPQGKKRILTVRSWATIKDVKDAIQQMIHVPPAAQRLYFGPLLTAGRELPNHRTLHDAGIYRSGETLLLDIQRNSYDEPFSPSLFSLKSSTGNDICISSSMIDSAPRALRNIVQQARRGLALGFKPEFVLDGSGGTYFLHDARKNKIGVFKPADEEPYAENNPRGYLPQPGQTLCMRKGVKPGEACMREVAAYLLDHEGVAGVPMTTLAEARHPTFNNNGARLKVSEGGASVGSHSITPHSPVKAKITKKAGSFQEFVQSECTIDDISPSMLNAQEVQKIAILDIRIMNADRNAANLLCRRREDDSIELVPIDHGYCLRSVCDVSWMDWCWLDWPQLKQPICDELKQYILNLDIEADSRMLHDYLNISHEAVDIFRASTALLKAGVNAGLTLYDIAILCCRNDNLGEVPSALEKLAEMASELATVAVDNERWHHSAASRALVDQLSPNPTAASADRSSGFRLHKCASSGEMLSFSSDSSSVNHIAESLTEALARHAESPTMVPSTASSDSSTESVDAVNEKDECEEWAANVLADVRYSDIQINMTGRTHRSSSITSDDASSESGLSSSPNGFWHVRPGMTSITAPRQEGSVVWSPQPSPRTSDGGESRPTSPLELDSGSPKGKCIVKFAEPLSSDDPFVPPVTVSVSKFRSSVLHIPTAFHRSDSGMTRSKSYSVLSRSFPSGAPSADCCKPFSCPKPSSGEYEHYRTYFLKFIDLVIVREITAALHHSKRDNVSA